VSWSAPGWQALADELAAWADAGRRATFWWRDDDAGPATPPLRRLLDLARGSGLPLAVAVVPAWLTDEGAAVLAGAPPGAAVVQHGWAHANHEPAAAPGPGGPARRVKGAECGAARPAPAVLAEIAAGRARLAGLGPRVRPAFVPPWNRVAPAVVAGLPGLGLRVLSTFGPRPAPEAAPGLRWVNAHLDPIVWREGRRFVGAAASLAALAAHLGARRRGTVDADEPTGLVTHHAVLDEEGWRFLATLLDKLPGQPAVACPPLDALLG
jgi:hypothetical protein